MKIVPVKKWQPPPATFGPEKTDGGSIVLLGSFNPRIFHPLWFAKQGLIPEGEATTAEIQIVHQEVASFSLDWLGVQVTKDRFTASTADAAHLEPLRDLVVGTFSILEHTPVEKMGINSDVHIRLESSEALRVFGKHLFAQDFWEHLISEPRPDSIRILGRRRDSGDALLRVTIEPSIRLIPGVYFGFNEHYEAEGDQTTEELLAMLRERWRPYQSWTRQTAEHILSDFSR